jgi:transposase
LDRFEERGFNTALYDDKRPGKDPELAEDKFDEFAKTLQESPEEVGYDEPAWTSKLARQYLIQEYDVAYSLRHVQRLMKEAEVSWKKPRPEPSSADEEDLERHDEKLKKPGRRDGIQRYSRLISFGKQLR